MTPAPKTLVNQTADILVWNRGTNVAILLSLGTLTYWEIPPGESLFVHTEFPPSILIAGTIEIEVIE